MEGMQHALALRFPWPARLLRVLLCSRVWCGVMLVQCPCQAASDLLCVCRVLLPS